MRTPVSPEDAGSNALPIGTSFWPMVGAGAPENLVRTNGDLKGGPDRSLDRPTAAFQVRVFFASGKPHLCRTRRGRGSPVDTV